MRVREWLPDGWSRSHAVTVAAVGVVGAATAVRAWAVADGWFYNDDLELLAEARASPLTWDFVMTPHDDKLMPAAHVLSWLVGRNSAYGWTTAATITTMWWSAGFNQLPLQIALFTSVTSFVAYQRTGRLRHVAAVCLSIAAGLAFYEKTLLVAGLLVGLGLAYFAGSGRWPAASTFWRSSRIPLGAVAALCLGYLALRSQVARSPLQTDAAGDVETLVDAMVLDTQTMSYVST